MRLRLFSSLLLLHTAFTVQSLQAGNLTVNTTDDHNDGTCDANDCTLREAIAVAQPNNTIDFAPAVSGTITLTGGALTIDKNLTIVGPGLQILTVSGNNASQIFLINGGVTARISGLTMSNGLITNTYGARGGAINNEGALDLSLCEFTSNEAIANGSGSALSPSGVGGAVANFGTMSITSCSFSSNLAKAYDSYVTNGSYPGYAGGGALYSIGTLVVRGCTFSFNSVNGVDGRGGAVGGAVATGGGTTVVLNSTVSNNTLIPGPNPAYGGGIDVGRFSTAVLVNCTIIGNTYQPPPAANPNIVGGGVLTDGVLKVQNTFIVNNTAPSSPDVFGMTTSRGYNVVSQSNGSSGWIATDKLDGNASPANYTGLVDNGGPTPTHAPQPPSVAIDGGSDALAADPGPNHVPGDSDDVPLTTDQRGYPRMVGSHVDIGAVEYEPLQAGPDFVVTTTDEHSDHYCGVGDCSLWDAANAAGSNSDASTITFKPGLTGIITTKLQASGIGISSPITINGPGARVLAISGAGVSRVFNITSGPVTISDLTVSDGRAAGQNQTLQQDATNGLGGGIISFAGLTLTNCAFTDNTAIGGGGFIGAPGANGYGGAIFSASGSLTLNRCTFAGNTAEGGSGASRQRGGDAFGGAMSVSSALTLINCTFNNNTAVGGRGGDSNNSNAAGAGGNAVGGGFQSAGSLAATNCTISGNASNGGHGGFNADFVFSPDGTGTGGGIDLSSGDLRNSIVAANTASTTGPDTNGTISSTDHCLIGGNPLLGNLKNNGGPTDTMALLSGSAAVNAGNDAVAPRRDQRGYARAGISDIGSFEANGIPLRIISIARNGADIVITFGAFTGETYQLQRTSSLTIPEWQIIGSNLASTTTGTMHFTDTGGANLGHAFYHIIVLP